MKNGHTFDIGVILFLFGALWIITAIYSTRKGAGDFSYIGITTIETTKSPEAWMSAHLSIKKSLIITGSLTTVSGLGLIILSFLYSNTLLTYIGWIIFAANIIFIIYVYIKANNSAKNCTIDNKRYL